MTVILNEWYPLGRVVEARTYGLARRKPGVVLKGGSRKAIHHKTQVQSENAWAMYGKSSYWPTFTVGPSGTQQHLPISVGAYALANKRGGVQTNACGSLVAQIEVVGFSGVDMPRETRAHLLGVLRWLRDVHGVPWVWPSGRPAPQAGPHNRNVANWLDGSGHFAHSQVPENTHWDTAYTDAEWWLMHYEFERYARA